MSALSMIICILVFLTSCQDSLDSESKDWLKQRPTQSKSTDQTQSLGSVPPSEVIVIDVSNNKVSNLSSNSVVTNGTKITDNTTAEKKIRTSNGIGGTSGFSENPFVEGGLNGRYKINVPTEASTRPLGLHIHLHGDGGDGYEKFPNREFRNDLIGVAVQAPNGPKRWHSVNGNRNIEFLQTLIQTELTKKWNIDLDRIYFSGVSGGAYFLSGFFLPKYGHVYNSGAYLMCGGIAPRANFVKPESMTKFKVFWRSTVDDFVLNDFNRAIDFYRDLVNTQLRNQIPEVSTVEKLSVPKLEDVQKVDISGTGGHCVFDGRSYSSGIQLMIDNQFSSILNASLSNVK